MKTGVILLISCICFLDIAWSRTPYNPNVRPYNKNPFKDDSRRGEALQEKAESSAARRRAQLLVKENEELKSAIDKLLGQIKEKDKIIQQLKIELDGLSKQIEALQAVAKNTNENGVVIDDLVVHSKPFFDIYLGEPYQSVSGRLEVESESITLHDKDRPGKTYRIRPTRDNIETLCVRVHQGRVYEVIVSYKYASTRNYESIKKQLLKTFHPKEKDSMDIAAAGDCMYTTVIDSIPIDIMVDHA